MTVTPAPDTPPSTMMTDEEYGAVRASAALWVGTSVLITDERGRILVQHVDYRTTCLLPGPHPVHQHRRQRPHRGLSPTRAP